MNVLINAGPTRESIDPVRFITNRSTGKMGYAIAEAALKLGYSVTLVSGPVSLPVPEGLSGFVQVESAAEMAEAMKREMPGADLIILCAAVADYRPVVCARSKLKKSEGNLLLELERTEDIALSLGKCKRSDQLLIGFAAETDDLESNALRKMKEKNFDWIAANEVGKPGQGFASDSNALTLYASDGRRFQLKLKSKKMLASELLSLIVNPG